MPDQSTVTKYKGSTARAFHSHLHIKPIGLIINDRIVIFWVKHHFKYCFAAEKYLNVRFAFK